MLLEFIFRTNNQVSTRRTRDLHKGSLHASKPAIILLDQIRPLLRNRIRRTHDIPAHVSRKHARVHYPQPVNTFDQQPLIHNLPHTRRADQMVLRTDVLPHIRDPLLFRVQAHSCSW